MRRDHTTRSSTAESSNAASVAHELVPLGLATRLISARAYGGNADTSLQRLTGIAHTMAALVPLYVRRSDGSGVRRLTEEELRSGFFRKDGGELHFTDGRRPVQDLAVTHAAIEEVARLLASAVDAEDGARELLRAG
jgi:hypothetical protein